jgi:hypothetical protein
VTNRTMFDSDNLPKVPRAGASMIAFYLDLVPKFTTKSDYVESMFPKWSQIPIKRNNTTYDNWRVLDVESGAINPSSDLETEITQYNATSIYYKGGGRPIIYCDVNNIPAVRQNTGKWILGQHYYLWVASWGKLYSGLGVVACQNENHLNYDSSVVFSDQWVPNV